MSEVLKAFKELDNLEESVNTNIVYHRTAINPIRNYIIFSI